MTSSRTVRVLKFAAPSDPTHASPQQRLVDPEDCDSLVEALLMALESTRAYTSQTQKLADALLLDSRPIDHARLPELIDIARADERAATSSIAKLRDWISDRRDGATRLDGK